MATKIEFKKFNQETAPSLRGRGNSTTPTLSIGSSNLFTLNTLAMKLIKDAGYKAETVEVLQHPEDKEDFRLTFDGKEGYPVRESTNTGNFNSNHTALAIKEAHGVPNGWFVSFKLIEVEKGHFGLMKLTVNQPKPRK